MHNAFKAANDLADLGFAPFVPHFTHFWHLLFPRPYEFWLLGSPTAWGVMAGLALAPSGLRALAAREPVAVALAAVIGASALLGFTKAETERIWLPFVPLACVAASAVLPARRLPVILWLLVAQALAVELLFDTVW